MGLKELLLNKGWAGTTMSRRETVERLNPILRRHYELNHSYDYLINNLSDVEQVRQIEALQKVARVDVGKLSESILSAGGVPYSGVGLEAESFNLGSTDGEMLRRAKELESEFDGLLSEELEQNHQMRTKAILSAVLGNSRARLEFLRGAAKSRSVHSTPAHS
ncbi:MAG: hypothetical protein WED81_02980 [Rhodothermales bacterium]